MKKRLLSCVAICMIAISTFGTGIVSAASRQGIIAGDTWTTKLSITVRTNGNSSASSETSVSIGDYLAKRETYTANTSVTYKVGGVLFQTRSGSGTRDWPWSSVTATAQTDQKPAVPSGTVLSATSTHSYKKGSTTNSLSNMSVSGQI